MTPAEAVDVAYAAVRGYPPHVQRVALPVLLAHLLDPARPGARSVAAEPQPPAPPPDVSVPIAEFLARLPMATSHPHRVVAIAYWQEKRQPDLGITTKDLMDAYQRARQKRPQNFPDVIASCMRRGLLIEAGRRDGMKSWTITQTGERLVEGER